MSSSVSFGGLITGLDTNAIVSSLVAAEKAPATALQTQQTNLQTRSSTISDFVSKLSLLSSASSALGTQNLIRSVTTSSSDTSTVSIAASGAATPGTHTIHVTQLAQASLDQSKTFASNTAGVAGTGTLTIQVGSDASYDVSYDSTDTLDTIANKINGGSSRLNASVLFDGTNYRLLVQGRDSGAANGVKFTDTAGTALGFNAVGANISAAQDAQFTIDTISVTRPRNIVSDVLGGVSLTLNGKSGATDTKVTIANDIPGEASKIQKLVDAYNAIATPLATQLAWTGTAKGNDTLFGDSTALSLQDQMQRVVVRQYTGPGGTSTSAAALGISLQSDGTLAFDTTKFTTALQSDPQAAEHLLLGTGNSDGLNAAINSLVTNFTDSTKGAFTSELKSLSNQITTLGNNIDEINANATKAGDTMRAAFTQMEQAISDMKLQSSYLTSLGLTSITTSVGGTSS